MSTNKPVLSICVPSRNRQFYFQETIKALTSSLRSDVEFVFVDNSDEPSIMDSFIKPFLADPRVRYVRTGTTIRSMLDNWETAIKATSGRWVTFIGDDDYADPEIAGVILKIEDAHPGVEALDWAKLYYAWQDGDKPAVGHAVTLESAVHEVPHTLISERAFEWLEAKQVIVSGFGIYHGAISRPLLERITRRYDGRFFEFPIVDYESVFKIVMNGKSFVNCGRPLSVMGACPLSNTAALKTLKDQEKKQAEFDREFDTPLDKLACFQDYPFRSRFGIIACIGMTHKWFADRHGVSFSGYEKNFVRACAAQCNNMGDRDEFDLTVARYRAALAEWKGGKYQAFFHPSYSKPKAATKFSGVLDSKLYVSADNEPSSTCAGYYNLVSGALVPVEDLVVDPRKYAIADKNTRKRAEIYAV
jgi:glycosyltransferase involved in cell wall biosynthesis